MTHILQPLDKAIFKSFKLKYKETIHEFSPNEPKKEKWTKLDAIKVATVVAKQVMIKEKILKAFAVTGIEPLTPTETVKKIKEKQEGKSKKRGRELTNEELQEILALKVIIQKVETKKGRKRIPLKGVLTRDKAITELKKKKEARRKEETAAGSWCRKFLACVTRGNFFNFLWDLW